MSNAKRTVEHQAVASDGKLVATSAEEVVATSAVERLVATSAVERLVAASAEEVASIEGQAPNRKG